MLCKEEVTRNAAKRAFQCEEENAKIQKDRILDKVVSGDILGTFRHLLHVGIANVKFGTQLIQSIRMTPHTAAAVKIPSILTCFSIRVFIDQGNLRSCAS